MEEEEFLPFEARKKLAPKMEDFIEREMVKKKFSSLSNLKEINNVLRKSTKKLNKKNETLDQLPHIQKNQIINKSILNKRRDTIRGMINAIIDLRNKGNKIDQIENRLSKGEFHIILQKGNNKIQNKKLNFNEINSKNKRLSYNILDKNNFYKKIKKLVISPKRCSLQINDTFFKEPLKLSITKIKKNKENKNKNKLNWVNTVVFKSNDKNYKQFFEAGKKNDLNKYNLTYVQKKKKFNSNTMILRNSLSKKFLLKYQNKNNSIISNSLKYDLSNRKSLASRILLGSEQLIQKNMGIEYQLQQFNESNYRKLIKSDLVYDSLSESEEEFEEPIFIFHPESSYFIKWKIILFICLSYNIIITPLGFSFYYKNFLPFLIGDFICDFISILNFILQFFIPYPDYLNETYETHHLLILKHYLSTWFFMDIITDSPLATIINFKSKIKANNYHNNCQLIHLFKILRIFKLFKYNMNPRKLEESKISKISMLFNSTKTGRLIFFSFIFIILNHILSCIYCFIGRFNYPNWITSHKLQDLNYISIYLAATYFNLYTIYSIGYGNIVPISIHEKVYTIFLQTIGIFIYSFLVSHMMLILKISPKKEEFERKLNILNDIKIKYNIKNKLYHKIRRILDFNYEIDNTDKFELLNYIPSHIRYELIEIMYKNMLNFKFFKNTNLNFISKIIINFKPLKASFGDIIIKENDDIDELIFVIKGKISIECIYKNKIIKISEINNGENFGEINLFLNQKSSYDLIVKSRVAECVLLSKEILFEIANEFSDIFNNKIRISMINFTLFERKLKKKRKEIDNELRINNEKRIKKLLKKNCKEKNENENGQVKKIQTIKELSNEESAETLSKQESQESPIFKKNYPLSPDVRRRKNIISEDDLKIKMNSDDEKKVKNKNIISKKSSKTFIMKGIINKNNKNNINIKNKSLIIAKNIFEGSLNINKPKQFYTLMFNKITLKEQIKKIENIHNKIKTHYKL